MLSINTGRFLDDFAELAAIGGTPEGGVSRPALSDADLAARAWLRRQIEAAGLAYRQDSAGNQYGRLIGRDDRRVVLTGSHLDSVPNGGRFDGALGVVAALEALRTIKEAGQVPPVSLELVNFTDEEGTLLGLLGSRAMVGALSPSELNSARGSGPTLDASLERAGLSREGLLAAARDDVAGYIELHIEQGKRLEQSGTDIGAVTALVGIRSYILRFVGQAAHAGTTPMKERADALWVTVDFIQRARQRVIREHTPGVINFGIIEARPGAFNIVPGEVELAMEFRHGSDAALDDMEVELLELAYDVSTPDEISLMAQRVGAIPAAPLDERAISAVEEACEALGFSCTRMLSFAGHDAQSVARIAPSAMLFVPSVAGLSHNPAEFTREPDIINGANVLLHSLLKIAAGV